MKFRFKEETPAGKETRATSAGTDRPSLDQRKQEAEKIRVKYPERIPVSELFVVGERRSSLGV